MKHIGILIIIFGLGIGGYYFYNSGQMQMLNPVGFKQAKPTGYLERYDFNALRKRGGVASEIKIIGEPTEVQLRRDNELKKEFGKNWKKYRTRNFESKVFSFESDGKKISGMINVPDAAKGGTNKKVPIIIMIRGYADKEGYYPGFGSFRAADKLAENGYVTTSLDFLGYGKSDDESTDMLEARFEKVVAVLDLIESVKRLPYVNPEKIGIWSHSNGGQITLSVLEILGKNYPGSLWAPMTNPFPQSVLDTASDLDDGGKLVISAIEKFQKEYDARRYAFENYLNWINAPIIIHQGTADPWCKVDWQKDLKKSLKNLGKKAELNIYNGDDHNLSKSWDEVVKKDIEFFGGFLVSK